MSELSKRLAEKKQAALYDAIMARGTFTDTGEKYTPEQATADADNSALRMTAEFDEEKRALIWHAWNDEQANGNE